MIRTLIVDDQHLIREGIKALLKTATEIEIVGAVNDGESALRKVETIRPDVVLLDIDLPGIDGLTVANEINLKFPQVKIIMLSSYEEESYVSKSIELGAKGYLLKNVTSEELEWSIKLVHQGYSTFKSELLTTLISRKKLASLVSSVPEIKPGQQTDVFSMSQISASSQSPTQPETEAEVARMEALLARNHTYQKYSKYSDYSRQHRRSRLFDNVKLNQVKKTIMSFEFQLLVFIILFSLGFLVFVALSS
ncbi:MAG: response regulator transcription factor [Waterburya sp.]